MSFVSVHLYGEKNGKRFGEKLNTVLKDVVIIREIDMKDKAPKQDISAFYSDIIEMAWCDESSFDAIESQTGLLEKDVIKIMRTYMKPSSFRMWRKRVSGRTTKHERAK